MLSINLRGAVSYDSGRFLTGTDGERKEILVNILQLDRNQCFGAQLFKLIL
jgi:hypothetical protein